MTRRTLFGIPLISAPPLFAQFGPPTAPAFEKISARLEQWARSHPRLFQLAVRGKSIRGRPVYAARITDPEAPAEQKEHTLLTALHAGQEHSGATSTLTLMEWLLSGDPGAREVLKRQVVMAMPVVNPDSYVDHAKTSGLANALGRDPYTGWTINGPEDPERCPEAVAVKSVLDEFQAEVHADLHGNTLPYPGAYQIESTGRAYSNITLRPYHHEIIRLMDQAALEEGYPSDELEEDAERLFTAGADIGIPAYKLWGGVRTPAAKGVVVSGVQKVYAALYGYHHYHTMPLASEIGWERSGFLRHRRLLRIGNEIWPGEFYPGYPVRVIAKEGYNLITAYGTTAAARRRSRIELWNKQAQLTHGENRPHAVGRLLYVCATSRRARARYLGDTSLKAFAATMASDRIRSIVAGFPEGPGQWGPTSNVMIEGGSTDAETAIEHGLAFRLRLPFSKARDLDVWMNDKPLVRSETDGYVSWVARGFTYVQINVPPERGRREDFFAVTIRYDPGESRVHGLTW
ncbi:MAG: M14 family zinc carboxypeptidase [Bryobacteraceae bacterium]